MKRPSRREIDRRLKEAKEALELGQAVFANSGKVDGELMELGIGDSHEVWELILQLLPEIALEDYEGSHPPQKNYEPKGKGLDLWAFCWYSNSLNKWMYMKFAVRDKWFYYVSLHISKKR